MQRALQAVRRLSRAERADAFGHARAHRGPARAERLGQKHAEEMLRSLQIDPKQTLGTLSKGTLEKVQLILVMSRAARLYLLDEPIGGVDPAARDYILNTILKNYERGATILLSTHLIWDIERILDDIVFIRNGQVVLASGVEEIHKNYGKSVDELFREVFRCW